jgi:GT2 family glycosyltransferase
MPSWTPAPHARLLALTRRLRTRWARIASSGRLIATGRARLGYGAAGNGALTRGRFQSHADDPHIALLGVPATASREAALFKVAVADLARELVAPVLYLDHGNGFSDSATVPLLGVDDLLVGEIPTLANLRALRLDPSEQACGLTLGTAEIVQARAMDPAELDLLDQARTLNPDAVFRDVALNGVVIEKLSGVRGGATPGELVFLDGDPRVILRLDLACAPAAAILRFHLAPESDAPAEPRLFFDPDGAGYAQERSVALARQDDGGYRADLIAPTADLSLRWDPSSRRGRMRLLSIDARAATLDDLADAQLDGALVETTRQLSADEARARAAELSVVFNVQGPNAAVAAGYDYGRWIALNDRLTDADRRAMAAFLPTLKRRPRFAFVVPTYNTDPDLLTACIASMQAQTYPDFEICIADDRSTDPRVGELLRRAAAKDARIKLAFRETNGHISRASNTALEMASGDFVVLVDHDDIVPEHCLATVAAYVDRHPDARVFYSDEDKLDPQGRRVEPYFKPDFNRFLLFGQNMVSHLGVYDRALLATIGGFRESYEGSQDYDLVLRCLRECGPEAIVHIPHVLYHWRMTPGSTAASIDEKQYAAPAARRALDDYFRAEHLPLVSAPGAAPGITGLDVLPDQRQTPVSIVIPTRDGRELLAACIESLAPSLDDQTEVVIVDNGTREPAALAYLAELAARERFKIVEAPGPFNFSRLCNLGVEAARGEIICLLNNDTELLAHDWLKRARALLALPEVGAVGARLVYPDLTLQHFGLILGMGEHGVAGTPHRGLAFDATGPFGRARLIQAFSAVTAACLFVRREDYLAVGGFDLDLPVAYNDIDFCLKLGAAGRQVLCDPEILLIHKESKTRGADIDEARAERLRNDAALMRARWGARLDRDPFYNPNLTLDRDDFSFAARPREPYPWR